MQFEPDCGTSAVAIGRTVKPSGLVRGPDHFLSLLGLEELENQLLNEIGFLEREPVRGSGHDPKLRSRRKRTYHRCGVLRSHAVVVADEDERRRLHVPEPMKRHAW